MSEFILEPTSEAQWYRLINTAEEGLGVHLDKELESYLVRLLQQFMKRSDLVGGILAADYLMGLQQVAMLSSGPSEKVVQSHPLTRSTF